MSDDELYDSYIGGQMDGETEITDLEILREQLGTIWEARAGTARGEEERLERYELRHDDEHGWAWAWHHIGDVPVPEEDRTIALRYVGGPRDGEYTIRFGSIRTRPELWGDFGRGYRLVHRGDRPLTGWQIEYQPDAEEPPAVRYSGRPDVSVLLNGLSAGGRHLAELRRDLMHQAADAHLDHHVSADAIAEYGSACFNRADVLAELKAALADRTR